MTASGDLNGDGFDDLVVGSPGAMYAGKGQAGTATVVSGRAIGWPPSAP